MPVGQGQDIDRAAFGLNWADYVHKVPLSPLAGFKLFTLALFTLAPSTQKQYISNSIEGNVAELQNSLTRSWERMGE